MNTKILVSIIIDNYNYGHFLGDAIDSALQQTYGNTEVIVVDDGSTDASREIICRYGDRIIPIFKENGGQASAFNAGIMRSQGDVIIFLDADDMLLPDISERVVEVFHANPQTCKVQYRMEIINDMGTRTGRITPPQHVPLHSGNLQRHVLAFPFDMIWMPTSGNAFSAQALQQVFPVPEEPFRINADLYVAFTTLFFGTVVFLEDIGAYYRVHGSNRYALSTPTINLDHLRQTITYLNHTRVYIKRFADALNLANSPDRASDLLSVYPVAARLVSLKLEPEKHLIKEDTIGQLFWLGLTAVFRRFDLSLPMKCLFALWFTIMVPAPQPLARWLALQFLFPEKREQFNKLLGVLYRNNNRLPMTGTA